MSKKHIKIFLLARNADCSQLKFYYPYLELEKHIYTKKWYFYFYKNIKRTELKKFIGLSTLLPTVRNEIMNKILLIVTWGLYDCHIIFIVHFLLPSYDTEVKIKTFILHLSPTLPISNKKSCWKHFLFGYCTYNFFYILKMSFYHTNGNILLTPNKYNNQY